MKILTFDTEKLTEEQVALYSTAVQNTLDKLGINVAYDETSPDLKEYKVFLLSDEIEVYFTQAKKIL